MVQSAKSTPVKGKKSVKETPAKKTPVKKAPAKKAPAKESPAKETPTKKTPAKKAPAKKTPTKKSPAKNAPAPAKEIPVSRITSTLTQLSKFLTSQETSENELIEDDSDRQLSLIAISATNFSEKPSFKPLTVPLPNSIYAKRLESDQLTEFDGFQTLLIVRDAFKVDQELLNEKLGQIKISKIINGKDLKTTYKAFEARRGLLDTYNLVLADDTMVTLLPKLLGSKFYNKDSTIPVAVRVTTNDKKDVLNYTTLANSVTKVWNSGVVRLPHGNTMNIKLGSSEWFTESELAANIEALSKKLIEKFPIRSVFVKSAGSPALPLYYDDSVLEIVQKKESTVEKQDNSVEIDGVKVNLTAFEAALMELANPDELGSLFAKQVKRVKRAAEEVEQPKAKKAKK